MCRRRLGNSIVYLNAGAVTDSDHHIHNVVGKGHTNQRKVTACDAFWNVGVHTSATDGLGNVDIQILETPGLEQFNLTFCSIECLQQFFIEIIGTLEVRQKTTGSR